MNTFPIKELQALLKQAKSADASLKQFGATHHKYQWNPPASVKDVEQFEQKIGISLPETYRDFLLQAGDGGAGPAYGLFSLAEVCRWLTWEVEPEKMPYLRQGVKAEDLNGGEEEDKPSDWCRGCIPIGSQGDTYFTYLVVAGPDRGRVVYVEYELSWIFFPRELDFLTWYTRWLREVAKGYRIHWFGCNLDGDEAQLRQAYAEASTDEERELILNSMKKFPVLSQKSVDFVWNTALECVKMPDARNLLELLYYADPSLGRAFLEHRWKEKMYDAAALEVYYAIQFCHEDERTMLAHWWERIFTKLPQISQEHWLIAVGLLSKSKKVKIRDLVWLLDGAKSYIKQELLRHFGHFPDAVEELQLFLGYLKEREDVKLLNAALLAIPKIGDARILAAIRSIQEDFSYATKPYRLEGDDKESIARYQRHSDEAMVYRNAETILKMIQTREQNV